MRGDDASKSNPAFCIGPPKRCAKTQFPFLGSTSFLNEHQHGVGCMLFTAFNRDVGHFNQVSARLQLGNTLWRT
jgi:hypothetical protein